MFRIAKPSGNGQTETETSLTNDTKIGKCTTDTTSADVKKGEEEKKKKQSNPKNPEDFQEDADEFCSKLFGLIRESKDPTMSQDVYYCIRDIKMFLDKVLFSSLKLGQKFDVSKKLLNTLAKNDSFRSFLTNVVKKMYGNKSSTKEYDMIMWKFFMNGSTSPSDFGQVLCTTDKFTDLSKIILDNLFSIFNKQKNSPDQRTLIELIVATLHNICTFGDGSIICATRLRNAGMMPIYRKYLGCARLAEQLFERLPFLAAAADIMEEGDDILQSSRAEVEFMIVGVLEACKCWSGQFNGWFAFELGRIIGQLAVFDSNKRILVEYGVLKALNILAKQKEEIEQMTATKALAHLAFNEENRKQMIEDEELGVVDTLIDLCKSSRYLRVRESAKGILWTMSDLIHASKKYAEQAESFFERKLRGHVMISYSSAQRSLLLKIKEELTKSGFKVWMDVEQMHDNVYDRMAEAIEHAAVVLIAMSYSYTCSEYCRREAMYASSLKRVRIPLLVESNYRPDSWLALMTAGDYHYDFVNKPFDLKISELIKVLKNRMEMARDHVDHPTPPVAHGSDKAPITVTKVTTQYSSPKESESNVMRALPSRENEYKKFQSLSKEEVLTWMDTNKLPRDTFTDWRAKDFVFLARMKEQAPEQFYRYVLRMAKKAKHKDAGGPLQLAADLTEALNRLYL